MPFLDSGINFPCVIQNYTKFANFARLYFTIFATKRRSYTNFRMFYSAVVMNFTISIFSNYLAIMQLVHSDICPVLLTVQCRMKTLY